MKKARAFPYDLTFKRAAGTSRGVLKNKRSWFIELEENGIQAIGECGVFAGLSFDDKPEYAEVLSKSISEWLEARLDLEAYREWPSIRCGWEMALADLENSGSKKLMDNNFIEGQSIPINGLVWMGNKVEMLNRIEEKLNEGFRCIKLKIGAINFNDELDLLKHIRSRYSKQEIELRLDANGAFSPDTALVQLTQLSHYDIHSIEQPIRQGQWDEMARLCVHSPIPIALDEELINITSKEQKLGVLQRIQPQYIILKPSLIGGFAGSDEWISAAESLSIKWWATSALESNIGLNAIAQWTASKNNPLPQGLGTGMLYTNNIGSPLEVVQGQLHYNLDKSWDLSLING